MQRGSRIVALVAAGALVAALIPGPAGAASPKTRLISKTSAGQVADEAAIDPVISANGRYVAFESLADNLPGSGPLVWDVYVHDRKTKKTRLISKTSAGVPVDGDAFDPSISGDGRYVAFQAMAANLPGGDGVTSLIYVHDRKTKKTRLVSKRSDGTPADGDNFDPVISASGRFVAWETDAPNLGAVGVDSQIVVHDLRTRKTRLVSKTSQGVPGNGDSDDPTISGNGRRIAFETDAPNLGGDGVHDQIVVHDRKTKRTRLVSRTSGGVKANDDVNDPNISLDGRYVVFDTVATNLGSDGTWQQVVRRDLKKGRTILVSKNSAGERGENGSSTDAAIAGPGGRFVIFESSADNLPKANGNVQIYIRDLKRRRTRIVSVDNAGNPSNGFSSIVKGAQVATPDGRFVVFNTEGNNLPGGTGLDLVYIRGPLI